MTSTIHRPTAVGGFPNDGDNPDQRSREATNRCMANAASATDRARRQILASQEDIGSKQRKYAERSDQGHHSILHVLDEMTDQVAEGHKAMATKEDINVVISKLTKIENTLDNGKLYFDPAKEEEPEEYLDPVDD